MNLGRSLLLVGLSSFVVAHSSAFSSGEHSQIEAFDRRPRAPLPCSAHLDEAPCSSHHPTACFQDRFVLPPHKLIPPIVSKVLVLLLILVRSTSPAVSLASLLLTTPLFHLSSFTDFVSILS